MVNIDTWRGGQTALRELLFWLGSGLLIIALRAQAEVVPDLYAVTVPVAEQSQSELQRAAGVGLRELAVRISGRSNAASDPALAAAFAAAMRYLDQYRFERGASGDAPWLAQLHFAPAPVDAELRRAGLPIWGGNRPALQAVVVLEDKGLRSVIDENSPVANVLREQWRRRGLVLHLPRSASAVHADEVAQLDAAKVTASLPQRGDGLLLGRVVMAAGGACESNWSLQLGVQSFRGDASGDRLALCVASAFDRLVDGFAAQYAIAANSGAEGILLRVTGVVSFDDYATLLNAMRRLTLVKNAQPVLVHDDEIVLQLKIAGNAEQLARQLALESRLTPTENRASASAGMSPAALSYRWVAARN